MAELIDFSYARFSPDEVKAAGRVGVIRYVASGRPLVSATRAEVDAFRAAGLAFVAVWQRGKDRTLEGHAAGVADGKDALAYTATLGRGWLDPVYFSCDMNPTTAQLPTVLTYFEGAASVLGWDRVGAYANAPTIDYLHARTPMPLFWLHNWGSGERVPAAANLHQYSIDQSIGGKAVDFDRSLTGYYGQWGARVPSIADLRAAAIDARLPVETVPDFFSNGHDGITLLQSPRLGYLHHTVATVLQSVYSFPGQADWRSDVPSPRCNVYLARDRSGGCRTGCPHKGRAHLVFVSAGKAYHAGAANLSRIQAARAGRIGPDVPDASAAGLADDYTSASAESVGVEVDWTIGEPWPPDLLDLLARLMRLSVDVFGWSGVGHWIHHRQATARKTDMAYRGDIWARARNISPIESDFLEDLMAMYETAADFEAAMRRANRDGTMDALKEWLPRYYLADNGVSNSYFAQAGSVSLRRQIAVQLGVSQETLAKIEADIPDPGPAPTPEPTA